MAKLLMAYGFVLARETNHQIWRCPCGHAQITTNTTPSRGRADANATAQIKRTRRACKIEKDAT